MGSIFVNEYMEKFFSHSMVLADSVEDIFGHLRQAVSEIAEELTIGRVELHFMEPSTMLRPEGVDCIHTLFEGEDEVEEMQLSFSFPIGDHGEVTISYFPKRGCDFEENKAVLQVAAQQIAMALRYHSLQDTLTIMAETDVLMGIPNMAGFFKYINQCLNRGILEQFYAVYFNVGNFKYVNRALSYQQGNTVMRQYVAQVKSYLDGDERLARLGGDNYAVLVHREHIEDFVARISRLKLTYEDGEKKKDFVFGASIGISHLEGVADAGEVMQRVAVAFQVARKPGGERVVFFDQDIYTKVMSENEITTKFHRAIKNREFVVYYQPKVEVSSHELCGAEALVRWKHGDDMIPPGEFIPVLERDGTICRLDFYVLESVCQKIKAWEQEGKKLVRISSNFSRKHLKNPNLVGDILSIIDQYEVDHKYIEIEFTESEDYQDYLVMSRIVEELKYYGISTAIDDFGTGYSSLNMLKSTNLDIVKIDRSLIPLEKDYPQKEKDLVMFRYIVEIAKRLGMETVAEGVETAEQMKYLQEAGCDMVQGYLFDRPLPEEEFAERLIRQRYA